MSNTFGGVDCNQNGQGRRIGPRGSDIGEHALRLAVLIQRHQTSRKPAWWIFHVLGRMVASCIFYDCIQHRRGKIRNVFSEYYQFSLELMLRQFCDHYYPCSFVDRTGRRCMNTPSEHGAEHHNSTGKTIGIGCYESDFSAEEYDPEWICYIKTEINECEDEYYETLEVTPKHTTSREIASDLHLQQVNDFFVDLGGASSYKSHGSCFCCLTEIPRHPLPCGHVLCDQCVLDCGKIKHGRVDLEYCPLHIRTRFDPPWQVNYKSDRVGVRILCLDGGGMRGIVELEVLQAIEKALGGDLPIQAFFDLIVGTSTGGINALALGVKQWPVSHCISVFEKFCDQAFTEREFGGVWGLEKAALLNHGSMYKAKPLHHALQATLGSNPLFGQNDSLKSFRTKVAVTATSGNGKEAMIIANYNRPQSSTESQILVRPEDPFDELKVWEAAAATSAAPFYFKPYLHAKTGNSYIDGALYHNNPVHIANRERKLLWPDVAEKHPDLLLSIGTGHDLTQIEAETKKRRSPEPQSDTKAKSSPKRSRGIRRTFDTLEALYQRFDSILDAEQTWTQFTTDMSHQPSDFPSPYKRLNLDLHSKPPPFDAKDKFHDLQHTVRKRLNDPQVLKYVHEIACSLVATSFYFKTSRVKAHRDGGYTVTGHVRCKFDEASANLRALGKFLVRQRSSQFTPYFFVQEPSRCKPTKGVKVKLSDKILERIATYGMLRIPHLDIEVSNPMASTTISLVLTNGCDGDKAQRYLISGFPRTFVQELPCEPTRSKTRPSSKHRSMAQSPPRHTRVSSDTARPRPTPTYPGRQSYSPASTPPPPPLRPSRTSPSRHNASHSQQHPIPELPQSLRIGDPASRLPNARNDRTHGGDEQSDGQVIPDYLVERAAERIRRDHERRARRTRDEERKLVRRRERRESGRFER